MKSVHINGRSLGNVTHLEFLEPVYILGTVKDRNIVCYSCIEHDNF